MRKILKLLCVVFVAGLIGQGCETPEAKTQWVLDRLEKIGRVRYWGSGLFDCEQRKGAPSEDSPTGYLMNLQNLRFAKQTRVVPAKLGTTFGILCYVPSAYTNASARCVYLFPPIQNPTTGKVFTRNEGVGQFGPKPGLYPMVYTFAEDYEMVSGKWTFQIFAKDELVIEKTFSVAQKSNR